MDLDFHEILAGLNAIVPHGAVFELRLLGERKNHVEAGYFNDTAQAANALCTATGYYKGIYFTPNPVINDALARSYNRISRSIETQTHDPEIARRRWLLVDIDPKRPAGISSTDAEHENALKKAKTIAGMLGMYGFCDPMINDSGNGAHLMYRMDEENTNEVRDEIHTFLKILKGMFDDEASEVDPTVYNAARIWRVYGTWARKGDSTPDRPHRRSKTLRAADPFTRLSISQVLRFNSRHADLVKPLPTPGKAALNTNTYPQDETLYRRLNEYAMHNLKSWVPHFFPTAREYKEGYRVNSGDIGQHHEEDLTIHPWPMGIKYFGIADQGDAREGRRTPIGVIAEYALRIDKNTAARMLSDHLSFPLSEVGPLSMPHGGGGIRAGMNALLGTTPRMNFKAVRTIADLQKKEFTPVKWVVKDVIPTGNILLSARPKMRKTWLALQLCIAIATGRKFLDYETIKGDVLFLGLEDNERRMQNRIKTLQRFDITAPDLSGFRYWTGGMDYDASGRLKLTNPEEAAETLKAFPRGEAGVEALEQFLEDYPNTSTIVIDTLAHFRGERMSRDIYQSDYESMMPITKLAARKNVLIIPVTHEKKGNADRGIGGDFLEDTTGSAGITGGTDGVISIKGRRGVQDENESRKILISGRDIAFDYEIDVAFEADTGGWKKAAREDIKVAIRRLLATHPFLNQRDFMNLIPNAGQARLYQALTAMKLEGEIEQSRYGFGLKR